MKRKDKTLLDRAIQAGLVGYSIPIMDLSTISKHATDAINNGTPLSEIPYHVRSFCEARYSKGSA